MTKLFRSTCLFVTMGAMPASATTTAEPVNVTCQVLNASGTELLPDEQARGRDFEGMRAFTGASERFMFDVYLKAGKGRFVLLDKASGEKVVVEQSHFIQSETVTVALLAKDSDDAVLTLTCTGA